MSPTRRTPEAPRIPSRHPYQVWALAMLCLSGLAVMVAPQPSSVSALLPDWQRFTWAGLLTVAAGIGLVAAWWRDPATGLLAERAGHAGLAGGAFAYAVAITVAGGARGIVAAALLIGLTVAAVIRTRDITKDLRKLERLAPGPSSDLHRPPGPGGG